MTGTRLVYGYNNPCGVLLLVLYGCTLLNIPIGLIGAVYCQCRIAPTPRLRANVKWRVLRDCWLLSVAPIGGPYMGVDAYLLSGLRG